MCVCKQSEKITYGKEDQLVELNWKKIHSGFCLIELFMSIDLECASDQHFVKLDGNNYS